MSDRNDWNRQTIEAFRANMGQVGGVWGGRPLLLLTTTGAKSGRLRTNPMMYLREGDRLFVFASKGGAPTHPDWYHNLLAHPNVTVELGDQIYARWAEQYPQFRDYQKKTTRIIPVIELDLDDKQTS